MFSKHDIRRNGMMLTGSFAKQGYDWWWHSFTGISQTTGEERQFFVEYFLCNPELGKDFPVFGQLKENQEKGIKPSYLMVKAGCWGKEAMQLHRFFGWKEVETDPKIPFHVKADDCFVTEDRMCGSVSIKKEESEAHPEWMCDYGEMSWNIKIEKLIPFNVGYGASAPFRFLKAFEMYWHAEGMKSRMSGTLSCSGELFDIIPEKSFGYADKNWGRNFTSPWVWLSSSDLYSEVSHKQLENSVFDIGGGRPKVFCFPFNRKLLGAMYYEGKEYEFNFSKFWMNVKTDFDYEETEDELIWHVHQSNWTAEMDTEIHCRKDEMLFVNYESPDGKKRHNRLFNGGNGTGTVCLYEKNRHGKKLIDRMSVRHTGCEYGEYDKENAL